MVACRAEISGVASSIPVERNFLFILQDSLFLAFQSFGWHFNP